ncbi:esterase [Pseudomonas fluorescens HK44]|uniref:Esterase n=1 Tax=Pseudomonas fluorescens HK44 TaxID=1042209 RepID=A0A010TG01_PSEFL|nr:alpha/beta hydrolase [Pseudomonas fluorescens]EXF96062.1 esterase [Pseudomonas fluorescens HK44]
MALDAASQSLLGQLADQGIAPFHQMDMAQARDFMSGLRPAIGPGPDLYLVGETIIGSAGHEIRLRMLSPSAVPNGIIVYCHGGGWCLMGIEDYDSLGRFLAEETGCTVILVDYRLAPEHPYPAAIDDVWTALVWADENRFALGGSIHCPLLVMGDSAGGNLAAVVAQKAGLAGKPQLAQQVLVYPVVQPDTNGQSYLNPQNQGLLGKLSMEWFWDHYLTDVQARHTPQASPLLAADLSGLPPTLLITAEHDVLCDEGLAYALKLQAAGIEVQWRQFTGQMHGFFTLLNVLPESVGARRYITDGIKARLKRLKSITA